MELNESVETELTLCSSFRICLFVLWLCVPALLLCIYAGFILT